MLLLSTITLILSLVDHALAQQWSSAQDPPQDVTSTTSRSYSAWTSTSLHAEATVEIQIDGRFGSGVIELDKVVDSGIESKTGTVAPQDHVSSVVAELTSSASYGFRPAWNASTTTISSTRAVSCGPNKVSAVPTHSSNSSLVFNSKSQLTSTRSSITSADLGLFNSSGALSAPSYSYFWFLSAGALQVAIGVFL